MTDEKPRLTPETAARIREKVNAVITESSSGPGYGLWRLQFLEHALAEPYGPADNAFIEFRDLETKDIKWPM